MCLEFPHGSHINYVPRVSVAVGWIGGKWIREILFLI
jgi:hypothetical protein